MSLKTFLLSGVALTLGLSALAGADAKDKATTKPYPLTTCVVSGEKLGDMGELHVFKYEGREIKLCCASCEDDFRKDPKKYLAKLDKAAATQPSTQPAAGDKKHKHDHQH